MSTNHIPDPGDDFDWNAAEAELTDDGAAVLDLDAARTRRRPAGQPENASEGAEHDDDQGDDAESVSLPPDVIGPPVDPTDAAPPSSLGRNEAPRKLIVPPWARSRQDLYLTARWAVRYAGYLSAYHATRLPKYTAKTAWYGTKGAGLSVGRLVKWATAEEGNFALRQVAANRGDYEGWLKLDRQRQRQSVWRWWVTAPVLLLALSAVLVLVYGPVPAWWGWVALMVGLPLAARVGRPADARITDRVVQGKTYRKLTAELVRRGLTSLGIAGINQAVAKDPGAITFPVEIHRDGPGHLAVVDLPYGVEASEVIARRGRLASALRLPMDQVWPETDRTHTGRLALWVGYEPASAMAQPVWPLAKDGRVDVFMPFPFATDPRLRVVNAAIMYRNWLFGGQPGSGKTFALRDLVLAAGLDPRTEIRGYEFKGVGDFKPLLPLLTEYGNGFDDDTIGRCAAMLDWLHDECLRRSERIDFYAAKGMAPENKVTPELASLKGSGLHPLVVFIDEVQNLFLHKEFGKQAGDIAEKIIRLGRALGVILLMGTQIPDKDSLPTGITRNVSNRFCLSVADQTANDMILGTSMYKNGYRATVFEPETDAGWGIAVGLGKPAAYKTYYVDNTTAAAIVARAVAYRQKAGTLPAAPVVRDTGPGYDLLADLSTVWPAGEDAAWNETLIERLTELRPDVYTGWKPGQLTASLDPYGVKVAQIGRRIDGKTINRRGPAHADVLKAIAERNRRKASD